MVTKNFVDLFEIRNFVLNFNAVSRIFWRKNSIQSDNSIKKYRVYRRRIDRHFRNNSFLDYGGLKT